MKGGQACCFRQGGSGIWGQVLTRPFAGCVILGLHLSEPRIPIFKMGTRFPLLQGYRENKVNNWSSPYNSTSRPEDTFKES